MAIARCNLSLPVICVLILAVTYPLLPIVLGGWASSAEGHEIGNRRRIISVLRIQWILTALNILMYDQLLRYFDPDDGEGKMQRRRLEDIKKKCSYGLLIFLFLGQFMYYLYYAPTWMQALFFDISTFCAGIWTNLIAFIFGFFLVNNLREPLRKISFFRQIIDVFASYRFFNSLLYDRKSQIRFSVFVALFMSLAMYLFCDVVIIKERTIAIKNFSATSGKLTVAVVSDIHAGASVYSKQVSKVVDRLVDLDVDAVFMVGDMVDGTVTDIQDRVEPFFKIAHRFHTFFVTGNHDYYYGNVMEWLRLYERNGIHVLKNDNQMFKGVCIAGVNDISSGKMGIPDHYMNASTALRGCPKKSSRILLAHNPATIKDIPQEDLDVIDLAISGHTHAGQFYVVVPLVYWMVPYYYGMYSLPGTFDGRLMVSAGTLYQGPNMKMLGMSEIWKLTLVRA